MSESFPEEDTSVPPTEHYGFTRVGDGENLAKGGYAALDGDRLTLDDLLYALENHTHDARPRLADPDAPPSASVAMGSGSLPAGSTFYYSISYVDEWGLETAASPELTVETNAPIPAPTAPIAVVETGGTLPTGVYSYGLTAVTAAGEETELGDPTPVRVSSLNSRVALTLPPVPGGAVSLRIYRSRPGQERMYYWNETNLETIVDDGSVAEDSTISVPEFNETNSTGSIEIALPGGVPVGAYAWRIYRTSESGSYDGYNLVYQVTETVSEVDSTPVSSWTDVGDSLLQGEPRARSATVSGGRTIELSEVGGAFPLTAMPRGAQRWDSFASGALAPGKVYAKTEVPLDVQPVGLTIYFGDAPVTTAGGSQVGFEVVDDLGKAITIITDGNSSDPYLRASFPSTLEGSFQAELTTQANAQDVIVVDDAAAFNGQAVSLSYQDEYAERSFGVLDEGPYRAYVRLRFALDPATTSPLPDDLTIEVVNVTTGGILSTQTATLADDAFVEIGPVSFSAPGANEIKMVVRKGAGATGVYNVDQFRYESLAPTLSAGTLVVRALLTEEPDAPGLPAYVAPTEAHLVTSERRVYLREGVETSVSIDIDTSNTISADWTATSSQAWATATSGTTLGSSAITVDFGLLGDGVRETATITYSSVGYVDATVEVVALTLPASPGADANISLRY